MKKIILGIVFVFATSFSFASNNLNQTTSNKEVALKVACFDFTLSCGITGTVCGSNTGNMIDAVLFADGLLC